MNCSYFYDYKCFMGSNILGKQVSSEKIVAGPRVTVNSQNKKITVVHRPDPTVNKGDAGSLTSVANDTGPPSAQGGKLCASCSRFPTYIDYNAHGIPIPPESWSRAR
jgi:hypothetical protein